MQESSRGQVDLRGVRKGPDSPLPSKYRFRDFVILFSAAVVLTLPVLIYGPMASGHDAVEHRLFVTYFSEQFWAGDLYPRWLLNMNHGLGSATFFLYPPLPAYIVAWLTPLTRALNFDSLRIMGFLSVFVSGLTAFVWLRASAKRSVALTVAILYMLVPYHLTGDFYRRTAWPECWALAWMPLILYFTGEILKFPDWRDKGVRRQLVGLSVAYALMILSHLISVAMFSLIPLGLALLCSEPGNKLRSLKLVSAAMALGVCLSAFYFLPAFFEFGRSPASRFTNYYPFLLTDNLISWRSLAVQRTNFIHTVSLIVVDTFSVVLLCGIALLAKRNVDPSTKKLTIFWVAVSTATVFLTITPSRAIWESLPKLHEILQYPWRLNILLCIATAALLAMFLSEPWENFSWRHWAVNAILVLLVLTWVASYALVCRLYPTDVNPDDSSTMEDGWLPAWAAPGTDWPSALAASVGPQAKFLSSGGDVQVASWKPRHIKIRTTSSSGGMVLIRQFSYPLWRAYSISAGSSMDLKPAMPQGLLELQVPPGTQDIRIDLPVGWAERAGWVISFLSMAFCLLLVRGGA
jgi:6-pyruvoyl-tetrahydropterin synthase-like protein